ncbi:pro-pol protein [Moniliophthora roreri]|nr:pro-pol protein [Moniliophthora roreri]
MKFTRRSTDPMANPFSKMALKCAPATLGELMSASFNCHCIRGLSSLLLPLLPRALFPFTFKIKHELMGYTGILCHMTYFLRSWNSLCSLFRGRSSRVWIRIPSAGVQAGVCCQGSRRGVRMSVAVRSGEIDVIHELDQEVACKISITCTRRNQQ